MGLFDTLRKKKETAGEMKNGDIKTVYAPADGKIIPLCEFPDPVFSQGIIGVGCGILPAGDTVSAPFQGTVVQLSDTLHAVGVVSDDGIELLIHIGVDTVEMNGEGFQAKVKEGQKVSKGQPLITFSSQKITQAGHADAIAVIVANKDEDKDLKLAVSENIKVGEVLMTMM